MRSKPQTLLVALAALPLLVPAALAEDRKAVLPESLEGDRIHVLLPRDAIPAVDDPELVSAEEADRFLRDDEPVMGVFDGKHARAYSAWQLDRHEIVNDRLGQLPVAATW